MFVLEYVVTRDKYDEFFGQSGFFRFSFNQKSFGEIYPEDVIDKLCPEDLYDWICHLIEVAIHLKTSGYVLLSDIESLHNWLEFRRDKDKLFVSLIKSEKWDGSLQIEFQLRSERISGAWENEELSFQQFVKEIVSKAESYADYAFHDNPNSSEARVLKNLLKELMIPSFGE